ncbi:hypothetical protein Tco_0901027 [Tanacetum coccineum]
MGCPCLQVPSTRYQINLNLQLSPVGEDTGSNSGILKEMSLTYCRPIVASSTDLSSTLLQFLVICAKNQTGQSFFSIVHSGFSARNGSLGNPSCSALDSLHSQHLTLLTYHRALWFYALTNLVLLWPGCLSMIPDARLYLSYVTSTFSVRCGGMEADSLISNAYVILQLEGIGESVDPGWSAHGWSLYLVPLKVLLILLAIGVWQCSLVLDRVLGEALSR